MFWAIYGLGLKLIRFILKTIHTFPLGVPRQTCTKIGKTIFCFTLSSQSLVLSFILFLSFPQCINFAPMSSVPISLLHSVSGFKGHWQPSTFACKCDVHHDGIFCYEMQKVLDLHYLTRAVYSPSSDPVKPVLAAVRPSVRLGLSGHVQRI